MILEFTTRWPFVRRHTCPQAVIPATSAHTTLRGTPLTAHRSWVRTAEGVGWIHHHEADGYVIEFADGRLLKTRIVAHVEAPK